VQQAVQQLDGETLAVRNAAEAKLVELGERILPLLPNPSTNKLSAEATERLSRVRAKLELLRASKAASDDALSFTLTKLQMPTETRPFSQALVKISWSPPVRPVVLHLEAANSQAEDASGNTISPLDPTAKPEVSVDASTEPATLTLRFAPTKEKLTKIKGKVTATLLGTSDTFAFDALTPTRNGKPRQQKKGTTLVTLERFEKDGDAIVALLDIRYNVASEAADKKVLTQKNYSLVSYRGWSTKMPVHLCADQEKLLLASSNELQRDATGVKMTYRFTLPEKKKAADATYVLTYEAPTAMLQRDYDFTLSRP